MRLNEHEGPSRLVSDRVNALDGDFAASCRECLLSCGQDASKESAKALGPVIARQLDAKQAKISQSLRFDGWTILYVSTGESDDAFVFYSGNPMRSKYVTLWGGVALENEEKEIRAWTVKNAPGIPRTLADCFAWHVTKER